MDYLPCSLNAMIKEQRKLKQPFDPYARKVIMFQIFKALYYFNVHSKSLRSTVCVTEI